MKFKKTYIFIFLLLLSNLGCQSLNYYDGPARLNKDVSEVYTTTSEALSVWLTEIDGKADQFTHKKRLYLLPGKHSFKLRTNPYRILGELGLPTHWGYFSFNVDLKPGMTYMFLSNVTKQDLLSRHSSLCIYEEPQEQLDKKTGVVNEYRLPTDQASKIDCSLVEIK